MSETLEQSMAKDFEQTFGGAVDSALASDSPAAAVTARNALLNAVLEQLRTYGLTALPAIKIAALNIYDTKIAPIRILPEPWAAFEETLDKAGRVALEAVIDAIGKALATPTT